MSEDERKEVDLGARREAGRAVREVRFLETREAIVFYDPPKSPNTA